MVDRRTAVCGAPGLSTRISLAFVVAGAAVTEGATVPAFQLPNFASASAFNSAAPMSPETISAALLGT